MPAATRRTAYAIALLLVAFLSLRGAIGLWQQLAAAQVQRVAPITTTVVQDPSIAFRPMMPAEPSTAIRLSRTAADSGSAASGPVSWRAIESSASFVEGHAGPVVAAFIDLDCGYCSQLWRRVRAPLAAGRLRMRWIPVAVLAPDGRARAAALLHAADPVAALAAHESRTGPLLQPPLRLPHAAATSEDIAANNALLAVLTEGRLATPLLVARAADRAPRLMVGLSADLPTFLAEAR